MTKREDGSGRIGEEVDIYMHDGVIASGDSWINGECMTSSYWRASVAVD